MRLKSAIICLAVVIVLPLHADNIARSNDCTVAVDSCYQGYSAETLTDGLEIVTSDDWTLAGWASTDEPKEHWITLSWPETQQVSAVTVYWAFDRGFQTSKRAIVQAQNGDDWQTIGEVGGEQRHAFDTVMLKEPLSTPAIRVLQKPTDGPPGRSNIMWVGEMKVFGPADEDTVDRGEQQASVTLPADTSTVEFITTGAGEVVVSAEGQTLGAACSLPDRSISHTFLLGLSGGTKVVLSGTEGVTVSAVEAAKRAGAEAIEGDPITQLKNMHIDTPMEDAIIALPDSDNAQELGKQVQAAVQESCGLTLPMKRAADGLEDNMQSRTIIAIGSALNNPVIEVLYNRGFVYADRVYPGEGGYAVRTVHNPLGAGHNVVTASGSDSDGTASAVQRLCEHIAAADSDTLPRILDVELGPPQSRPSPPTDETIQEHVDGYRRWRESGDAPEWALNRFASYGIRYNRTGDEQWARLFRALMLEARDIWDESGPWPMEWLWDPYWAWETCEEAPCFTDEERLQITNFLLQVGRTDRKRYAGSFKARNEISGGHQLDQNLCLFCLADYFWKYYGTEEAREWLDAVKWRFETSAKYHRLRHDANDYNHAAYWFLLRHARISGDWDYVTNGQFGRFVMYTQMMLDNLGYRAQNGDAGSPFAGPQSTMYSMASWLYQDGKYKWAIRDRNVTDPGYYANNIEPVEPEELLGLYRFNIGPTFYEYLAGHSPDDDLPPGIVPIDEAWDKISLREGFDPDDQYLILDGMTAGEHGHDDANAVIRMTDNERIWLVDCDYIRRAPKWHNSAVVIKDGASENQKSLARCDYLKDFGEAALLRTTLPHYTGTDWERNIFWSKGEYLVFMDNFSAYEEGDYRLKTIWRTLGETETTGGDFHVRQAGERDSYAVFHPDQDTNRDGIPDGFTASYSNRWGEVHTTSALDHETYHSAPASIRIDCEEKGYAVIYAFWPVEGGEKYRFHTMCKTDTEPGCSATTTIYWTGEGRSRLPESARGGPQSGQQDWTAMDIVDTAPENAVTAQVCIRLSSQEAEDATGTCWFDDLSIFQIDANGSETAIFPRDDVERKWSHFYIKNADGARLHTSSFLQRGHPRKNGYWVGYEYADPEVKTLQQIADTSMQPGDARCFMNLLYTSDEQKQRSLDIEYLSPTAARITGAEEPALAAIRPPGGGPIETGALSADAAIVFIEGEELHAAGATQISFDDRELFSAQQPEDVSLTVPAGFVQAIDAATALQQPQGGDFETQQLTPDRQAAFDSKIRSLCRADIDGDGAEETIAGTENGAIVALQEDGNELWRLQADRAVRIIRAADLTGDGTIEIVAGGDDQKVRLISASGQQLWEHELEDFHSRDGRVVAMDVGDLTGTGEMGIVVGTEAWHWYCLDPQGSQVWRKGHPHATTQGQLADIDGDGDLEVVTGSEYYGWPIYDHTGGSLWSMRGGPGCTALAVDDLNGDGQMESLFGTGDCAASIHCVDHQGRTIWRQSVGDQPRAIITANIDDDADREVIVSSDAMFVYAFDADGTPLWRVSVDDICDVLAARDGEIYAGTRNRGLVRITSNGEISGHYPSEAALTALQVAGDAVLAGFADGRLLWLK
ncbi:MAG: discoidin domain-containing protein [Armatimonadota bacterium]